MPSSVKAGASNPPPRSHDAQFLRNALSDACFSRQLAIAQSLFPPADPGIPYKQLLPLFEFWVASSLDGPPRSKEYQEGLLNVCRKFYRSLRARFETRECAEPLATRSVEAVLLRLEP